jgi:predicted ATPase
MFKLPGPLRLTPSFPFTGRSRELAALRPLIPLAEGDGLRFALIGGEAGSGKSRLVREFAHEAAGGGALVLYGACDAVVRRPYRPFVEALDQLARSTDAATLREDLGAEGGELSRLLPDLNQRVGELPTPVAADPDTERHRLHSVVCDLLLAVGRRAPLVVVIEDVHWADTPTLLLLRHLARGASEARAPARDVPRHRRRGSAGALSGARGVAPLGGRRATPAGRTQRRGHLRVRRASGRR